MLRAPVTALAAALAFTAGRPAQAQSYPDAAPPTGAIGFGGSAAVAGDQVLVGRPGSLIGFPMPAAHAGSVLLFERSPTGWAQTGAVTPRDGAVGDGFGSALAADGDLLAVGAPGVGDGRGAVYLFQRAGKRWVERARLTATDATPDDGMGTRVVLKGGTLIASAFGRDSARGVVLVFRRGSAGAWSQVQTVRPSKGGPGDRFGAAIALAGKTLVVGAPGPFSLDSARSHPGAAFAFTQTGSGWSEEARLDPGSAGDGAGFGGAVLLDDAHALIGAPAVDSAAGAVLRFRREGPARWVLAGRLTPPTPAPFSLYGVNLARDGGELMVGAPGEDRMNGAVHVLRREYSPAGWTEVQRLAIDSAGFAARLGAALAVKQGLAVAGAPLAYFFEGAALVYRRTAGEWRREFSLSDSASGGPPAVTGGEVKCQAGKARGFECRDAALVSFLPKSAIGAKRGVLINDIWGWTDSTTGREFALVGRTDGTAFVEVTDPAKPRYLGELPLTPGARSNIWRDIKVYQNHAFIVADGAGQHGMQVFDLTQLRTVSGRPVTFQPTALYDRIASAHNIVIDPQSGYAYPVGNSMGGETCGGALHMVDIRDPAHPKFAGCYADPATGRARTGYTHDAQCVVYRGPDADYRGREICFNSSETALGIADVTDKANPKSISVATYPNVSYAHQGWLSEDQRYFFLDDEGDELDGTTPRTRTLVFDLADLDDPVVAKEYQGETAATDHNLYVHGNLMYESNYVAGLRIIDVKDPLNPKEVGFFDTVTYGENAPGFNGSWSNYPFFQNGVIAVTSMREGLFMVRYEPSTVVP
jgi:choice-of-anchor B domain-containing protein